MLKKKQGSGPNPYVECGIGAAIFPEVHWAAATSNVTWDLGSTALTSAISSPEMCNPKKVQTAQLIIDTLPDLEKDIALGDGEFVTALSNTMGCSAQKDGIVKNLRHSYGDSISNQSYELTTKLERATNMYYQAKDAAEKSGCTTTL